MHVYKTHEVSEIIGIHVNTVRLYEKYKLISKPERLANGYRVFTDLHIEQFKMARAVLKVEVLQNGLRKQAVDMLKMSALGNLESAMKMAECYLQQLDLEMSHAEEAIEIAKKILNSDDSDIPKEEISFTPKETAETLQVTMDTLRNWELNGLITVKRKQNRYRVYFYEDIQRLKIIRSLRCANYSLSSILRMLGALSQNPATDLRKSINTPQDNEDVITACDKLLTSLSEARINMLYAVAQIEKMQKMKK
ncbi:MerR family transcriptional regulator [Petroclostridium sp. X23]|uniref:MerR family transcriptional regulator n=1 Tax=Petroclostridium sp. X23 TaxID=3045146 RepID=UPI0024AE82A3|nr:MerR family transcriptional regulator [Petroclostridium sp. X23]WHH58557.1 MerR family transcriptional regulator [Petroclostridium sp. X23]